MFTETSALAVWTPVPLAVTSTVSVVVPNSSLIGGSDVSIPAVSSIPVLETFLNPVALTVRV